MRKPLTPEQKEARKAYEKAWREANKQRVYDYQKQYRVENPDINRIHTKLYRERNPDTAKSSSKKYKTTNKEKVKQARINYLPRRRELERQRKAADPLYKLKCIVHSMIGKAFNKTNHRKTSRSYEILGCSLEELRSYLEAKFEPWMNWDNRGLYNGEFNYGWDIDHIIPISSANTEEDVIRLSHYTNLQPLCSKVNRDVKKDKL